VLLQCASAIGLRAQNVDAAKGLRIDPSRPFVYLRFDHVGEGARVWDRDPATRIWLRLVNNCRLPIVVMGSDEVPGGLKDEVFLYDDVVSNRQGWDITGYPQEQQQPTPAPMRQTLIVPGEKSTQQTSEKKPQTKSVQQPKQPDDEGEMPLGYPAGDVVTYETVLPGENVLFSVLVNFISKKWHIEIGFDFDSENSDGIPERKSFANPDIRGHAVMTLTYGFWDLPEEHRAEVERLNQKLKPTR
jgi:hypothetical protein